MPFNQWLPRRGPRWPTFTLIIIAGLMFGVWLNAMVEAFQR